MGPKVVFGIAAGVTGLYAHQRYSGNVNYTGPAVSTPAGSLRPEEGKPDASAHRSIYIAAGLAALAGAAFIAGPKVAMASGAAAREFASDYTIFTKIGAGLIGAGAGTAGGTLLAT
ncbi:MAG: hypothetical protein JWM86_1002 [Thermoleophilia bacterium]|nr:hypothetical protein [Thermoleophilia bacterium]